MRLIAQAKQGFYPAPPEAIADILRHLKIPDPPPDSKFKREDVNILDPCAGEAKALVQLAEGLGVSSGHVFAIELNASRSARIAATYPDIRLLGPCSFEGTRITRHSFSLVYLNPPFDDEMGGGGREETSFLRHAVDLLVPGGILVLVCPVTQVYGKSRMCELLDTWFDQLELFLFPDHCRTYNECVVFGRRRKTALTDELIYEEGILTNRGVRRCSAAPIAKVARLGEPQFSQWHTQNRTLRLASPSSIRGSCHSPWLPGGSRRPPSPTRNSGPKGPRDRQFSAMSKPAKPRDRGVKPRRQHRE
jgi:Uncharacterised methyltransferase family (DUF6094)